MRILLILALIAFNLSANDKTIELESKMKSDIGYEDNWKLLEMKPNNSEEVWFFRKNIGVSDFKGKADLPILVYFTLGFSPKDESGLPNSTDLQKLYDFEDEIIPVIEHETGAILVASVVKVGVKDHLFYVSDTDVFLEHLSKYKGFLSNFKVSLEKQNDPKWEVYTDFPDGT